MAVPRALDPTGIILVDKPTGPSSFAIVAQIRSRTGARTGHAGTLDPFASGLLILLSGRATRIQERFMRLDKRYETTIDLSCRTTTGDPEGDSLDEHDPPDADELQDALARLRGTVELPVPAASAVKVDGERAYRLHRRGVAVEMPVRAMRVHELVLRAHDGHTATLELLVGSGTYVRALADALGGHCTSLRRTEIGPFRVEEADPERVIPLEHALARLGTVPVRGLSPRQPGRSPGVDAS
ncbi:MAG: tRNA pseudouridine(55) synthase TruB [Thermoleophilia bacterium]|nr:tRNA pseudouridine(55) synthase TruB [Thermoleophilia bacterium]